MSRLRAIWTSIRRRPIKFGLLSLGALLAIGLIVNAVLVWLTGAQLEAALMNIKMTGAPVSLTELSPRPVRPEENGAAMLRRVQEDIDFLFRQLADVFDQLNASEDAQMSQQQAAVVRIAMDKQSPLLELIDEAARAPFYDRELDYSKGAIATMQGGIDASDGQRTVIRVLSIRVRQLLADGEGDEALRNSMTMLRLSRQFMKGARMILDGLVAIACESAAADSVNRVLRTSGADAEMRLELDAELARHDSWDPYVHQIEGERVIGLACYDEFIPWKRFWLSRAYGNRDVLIYLGFMQTALDNAGLTLTQMERLAPHPRHVLPNLLLPAIQAAHEAQARIIATLRCLRILNAIQQQGKASDAKIDVASLGLPPAATIDPSDGQPLRIKQTEDGPIIYSIGANLTDEGGQLEKSKDVGIAALKKNAPAEAEPK